MEISQFVYSKNRKFVSLYLVIISNNWGSKVEYCSVRDDHVYCTYFNSKSVAGALSDILKREDEHDEQSIDKEEE